MHHLATWELAMTAPPSADRPVLVPDVAMAVTFYSERKGFAFAARHDNGASCYISPMLAEQIHLGRDDAGRQLAGTVAVNTDDHGAVATPGTPWRVMSWSPAMLRGTVAAASPPGLEVLRADLEDALGLARQTVERLQASLARLG